MNEIDTRAEQWTCPHCEVTVCRLQFCPYCGWPDVPEESVLIFGVPEFIFHSLNLEMSLNSTPK